MYSLGTDYNPAENPLENQYKEVAKAACTQAGGTWDSEFNHCFFPTTPISPTNPSVPPSPDSPKSSRIVQVEATKSSSSWVGWAIALSAVGVIGVYYFTQKDKVWHQHV